MKKLVLVVMILAVSFCFAGEFGLYKVAPTVGVIMPEDPWDMGLQIGAKANIGSVMDGKIGLFPVVSYWASKYDFNGVTDLELKLSNIKIGLDAHYDLSEYFTGLYAGAGLALNIVGTEYPSIDYDITGYTDYGMPIYDYKTTTDSNSESEIGISLLAGYNFELSGKPLFVEGRYDLIKNLNTLGVNVGMFFDMKK